MFTKEVLVMGIYSHPNILKFFGYSSHPEFGFFTVVEYCHRGSLQDIMEKDENLTWSLVLNIAIGIMKGLSFLVEVMIVHRNLSPAAIYIKEDWTVKLGKFGVVMEDDLAFNANIRYAAPELLTGSGGSYQTGLYSLSMILCEMASCVTGKHNPLYDPNEKPEKILLQVLTGKRPTIPDGCSLEFESLIKGCWVENEQQRPSFDKVMETLNTCLFSYSK